MNKKNRIHVYLNNDQLEYIKELAAQYKTSQSAALRIILAMGIEKQQDISVNVRLQEQVLSRLNAIILFHGLQNVTEQNREIKKKAESQAVKTIMEIIGE